ncbi:hypothetical protein LNAOJCKE_2260 [Methylorubrum aminovorans]|uniref:Uncharacterized protein n=1 Tax=Methylorubrum aminovorans TaxID=269069 RepID=A0ABQ4UE08_9HYPH|nr:hypothetical protein LNAOJCKE_2260 [Methylorubrum aminovorans]
MPAVGDLHGRRRAQRGAAGVLGRTIARHEPDLRLAAEPCGPRLGRAVGQQVERSSAFEIDDDGAVGPPLAQRPVINADDARSRWLRQRHSPDRPQQGRGTGRHGQVSEQAGGGLPTKCETGPGLCRSQPAGALGMAGEQLREALGKSFAVAGWVAAVEAPNLKLQPDGLAAGRQIGGSSPIPAMDRGADRPTCRAAGVIALRFGEEGDRGGAVPHDTHEAAARQREELSHTPICEAKPTTPRPSCHAPRSTKLADEPPRGGPIAQPHRGKLAPPNAGTKQLARTHSLIHRPTSQSNPIYGNFSCGATPPRVTMPAQISVPARALIGVVSAFNAGTGFGQFHIGSLGRIAEI